MANEVTSAYRRRVPRLEGAFLAVYRVLWGALFVASVVSLVWLNPRAESGVIRMVAAAVALDVITYQNPSSQGILLGPFDEDARRLGIRGGDLLVTVDGRPAPNVFKQRYEVLAGPAGSLVTLGLRHGDGRPYTLRIARDPERLARAYAGWGITFEGRRWFAFAIRTLAGIASIAAATLLFLRRPRDPVAQLLSFSLVLALVNLPLLLPRAADILIALQPAIADVLLMLAILLFPQRRFATRWHWLAIVAVVLNQASQVWAYVVASAPDWSVLQFLIPVVAVLVAVTRQLKLTPPGIARQQAKSVLFGVIAYCVLMIANTFFTQAELLSFSAGANGWFTLVAHVSEALAFLAIPAGLLVSLLRFRLYDAESAISRSIAYGALTLALLAVFAGSEKVIELLGEEYFGEHLGALAGGLGAAVAAVMIAPMHHRVTGWAERRFQGDLVHLRKGLPMLVGDMRETATPEALADAVLVRIEQGVRAVHGAVVAGGDIVDARDIDAGAVRAWLASGEEPQDGARGLQADRSDTVFPLRVPLHADGVGLVGWLLLGPRPDGSFYGKDEREALLEIADPVARALAISRERQARETSRREELGDLRSRLATIEDWVARLVGAGRTPDINPAT